ncbi:hypothetical protein PSYPI_36594 [Pseudomonas syringae pv. pisi str. 1704B]|uniref:Uncharacterized protein n=1 Tax=Pseudomonas syringae pv. pisi str. 1704B TaxID=629263 RepID=F3GK90_PSESJ|nr:hypothetical protein PSYPI_36594 [Pseudomonas syringae pv. pisi str. 1704B]
MQFPFDKLIHECLSLTADNLHGKPRRNVLSACLKRLAEASRPA